MLRASKFDVTGRTVGGNESTIRTVVGSASVGKEMIEDYIGIEIGGVDGGGT